jgi:hypothetical protein
MKPTTPVMSQIFVFMKASFLYFLITVISLAISNSTVQMTVFKRPVYCAQLPAGLLGLGDIDPVSLQLRALPDQSREYQHSTIS